MNVHSWKRDALDGIDESGSPDRLLRYEPSTEKFANRYALAHQYIAKSIGGSNSRRLTQSSSSRFQSQRYEGGQELVTIILLFDEWPEVMGFVEAVFS